MTHNSEILEEMSRHHKNVLLYKRMEPAEGQEVKEK